jgi:membrane associated rhomboid family serine protease
LFWFVLDLLGAFTGGGDIAHWAHIGGTFSGFLFGLLLLKRGWVDLFDYDNPTRKEPEF